MKNKKTLCRCLVAAIIALSLLSGCATKGDDPADAEQASGGQTGINQTINGQTGGDQSGNPQNAGDQPGDSQTGGDQPGGVEFSYSDGIDENGFWVGIRALDYVDVFNYHAISIPADVHQVTDDAIQSEIDYILSEFPPVKQVTDRAVLDGDKVNIDFVGSVGGVEFDNGSTQGMGADVTIGVTNYIDDFLEQLIGHSPGETVNVEVTFPDDYYEATLQGKDALFVTEINYIIEEGGELSDDYVAGTLFLYYGWMTVEDMISDIRANLKTSAIEQYIHQYFTTEVAVRSVPDQLVKYQESAMLKSYQELTLYYYGIELEDFLINYQGYSSVDEFVEYMYSDNLTSATYYLVSQAVAEDSGIAASAEDVAAFFFEMNGSSDYSAYEIQYGLPYLKQVVLCQKVLDYIVENAILS